LVNSLDFLPKFDIQCRSRFAFSGGLDSSVLAVLADRCLDASEPLDLLNVAFEQQDGGFDVPDRKTALKAIEGMKYLATVVSVLPSKLCSSKQRLDLL